MNTFRLCFVCLSFLLAGLVTPAVGQEKSRRGCRVLFLGELPPAYRSLVLFDGTNSQAVELSNLNFSASYKLPMGDIQLTLLEKPLGEDEQAAAGAPTLRVAEGISYFYLIVSANPKNKVLPLSMQMIDAGADKIGAGQTLWINLTSHSIAGRVGSQNLKLAPQSRSVVDRPVKSGTGDGSYPVHLYYQPKQGEKAAPLMQTQWVFDPHTKGLIFILQSADRQIPEVRGFSDFLGKTGEE